MARGSAGYDNRYISTKGFGDAYDKAQDRARKGKEYRNMVRQRRQKEADETFSQLVVEPSGQSTLDADAAIAAREKKSMFADLFAQKERGEVSPEDFELQKNNILNDIKSYNQGAANIKQVVTDFRKSIEDGTFDENATPAGTIDLLESLNRGEGNVTIKNVDGAFTMVGETATGEPISVPVSSIASGANNFKFAQKIDIQPDIDKSVKHLEGLKQQIALASGVSEQTLSWDQVSTDATQLVDNMLQDDTKLRGIASAKLGIDFEDFEEQGADAIRDQVKQNLLGEMQNRINPRQTGFRPAATQRQSSRATAESQKKATAGRVSNAIQNDLNKYLSAGNKLDQGALDQVIKHIGGNKVKGLEYDGGSSGFLGFGKSEPQIIITDAKGKKQRIPADAQGLINNVLRLEFGTAVDETQNQIGGEVKTDDSNPLGI